MRLQRFTRCFCSESEKYWEIEQLKQIKSPEFYEENAEKRRYFYFIDLQGRLFLEDVIPKNIATSLKSPKFLRFFYKQLRPNDLANEFNDYPYLSPCGKEMNYIKAADEPFVFQELVQDEKLVLNGNFEQPFDPQQLAISTVTGRLYHSLTSRGDRFQIGLVKSHLAVQFAEHFQLKPDGSVEIEWKGKKYPLKSI